MIGSNRTKPRSPTRREANVVQFRRFYRIYSCLVWGASIYDPDGYEQFPTIDIDDEKLGNAVREALAASRASLDDELWDRAYDYRRTGEFKKTDRTMLELAGVKSLRTLYRGAASVSVWHDQNSITILAWKNKGVESWGPVRNYERLELPDTITDAELGAAVREHLAISKSA
ncbi:contact-dependent growth inhibition system immunity protein [Notoacmeibacter sp. MSK16QG-6]|uniref:contact-dependent growth inhibition system immunity protein n=1 Tax=Notoacmeibacter sp. MSK16QG-6 TaxID=2957982 RepID=UPI0020A1010E|nr:contact-dependent growth inhibition system immunity protein [Notoacmeibacter sp. MSK16QG-6]MCP1200869.1 contact-dependent growth inhibition system immunity protein [Notoacmeibacter sp. MSK16QG-6]